MCSCGMMGLQGVLWLVLGERAQHSVLDTVDLKLQSSCSTLWELCQCWAIDDLERGLWGVCAAAGAWHEPHDNGCRITHACLQLVSAVSVRT
jgi:hypothetical protein